jgi:hypothetical protein
MKKVTALLAFAVATATMVSCKKCVSCNYKDDTGAEQTAESCGKKNNQNLEDDLNAQWGKYGEVVCTDK